MHSHSDTDRRIDAVIFDLGGVLIDWDPRHLYRKLCADEDEMEFFLREICTPRWHETHDRGEPTTPSCADLAQHYPEWAHLITAWGERSEEMVAGSYRATVDVLKELKLDGVRLYALTNMEAETYPLRLERFDFLRWFDGTVVSGVEGIAKPDREIYVRLLDRHDLTPETSLMIDDKLENLAAAERLGIVTHHFHSARRLRECLQSLSLLPTGSRVRSLDINEDQR